jgi:hypothetical protein
MRWNKYAPVAVMAFAAGALALIAPRGVQVSQEVSAAAPLAAVQEEVEPQAGLFAYVGGVVRGKTARTYTSASVLSEGGWRLVTGATLTRVVAAGTSDLINVAFSAECQVRSLGVGDTARIRIAHFVNGIQVAPVEPYDGDQRFCSANDPVATHAGNWAIRVAGGSHLFRVEVMPVDFGVDNGIITAVIDDWTFELVIYD